MTTVFLLVLYLGNVQQESSMVFADINRCKYFARTLMRQPAVPRGVKYKAICKPIEVDANNPNVRIYR
tara:strand:+ start:96 stop:299 length:204 start_codon:yes stop_codon:yes gene_type:complete